MNPPEKMWLGSWTAENQPPVLALLLALCAYALTVTAPFTFDDQNIFIMVWLTRPLTWLSYQLNGSQPWAFHAASLLLHLIAVWVCSATLRLVLPARAASTATLLFAVHPLAAETVNFVWGRAAILMAIFALFAVRSWLQDRPWHAVLWLAASLGAKEEACTLPLLLILLDLSRGYDPRPKWRPLAAMFGIAAAVGAYTIWAASYATASEAGAHAKYSALQYFRSQGLSILQYLRMSAVPWGFSIDPTQPEGWWIAWAGVAAVVAVSATRFTRLRWGFWVIAALLLLLPSSSVFPVTDLIAWRRMYFPLMFLAAALSLHLNPRAAMALACLLAILTTERAWVWSDNRRLWEENVRRNPDNARGYRNLAKYVPASEVIKVLLEAKIKAPRDATVAIDLVVAYSNAHEPWKALDEAIRAVDLEPKNPYALNAHAAALTNLDQAESARTELHRAVALDPCFVTGYKNLRKLGVSVQPPGHCRLTAQEKSEFE